MKKVLLVDDLRDFRTPPANTDLVIARTSAQGIAALSMGTAWDEIWLDHDLGQLADGSIDDVMRVVDHLSEQAFNDNPVQVGIVYVHTSNPSGARAMLAALNRFGYISQRVAPEPIFIVGAEG